MPALDIQKVADHGAGGLGGTCTLPDEREIPGEIRLHGDGVERSFDDEGVDFRDNPRRYPQHPGLGDDLADEPDSAVLVFCQLQGLRREKD